MYLDKKIIKSNQVITSLKQTQNHFLQLFLKGKNETFSEHIIPESSFKKEKSKLYTYLFSEKSMKLTSFVTLTIFIMEFVVPTNLYSQDYKQNFRKNEPKANQLDTYFNAAEKAKNESEWQQIVDSGKSVLRSSWEYKAKQELDKELNNITPGVDPATLRSQLNQAIIDAEADWTNQELNPAIDKKKGEWKANKNADAIDNFKNLIDTIGLKNAIDDGQAAVNNSNGTANEKIAAWDTAVLSKTATLYNTWKDGLLAYIQDKKDNTTTTGTDEKNAFEKKLDDLLVFMEKSYKSVENSIVGLTRQSVLFNLNKDADLDNAIAQNSDPNQIVDLLIDRINRNLDPNGNLSANITNTYTNIPIDFNAIGGDDPQAKVLLALDNGQKLWQKAIDDLIVQKLKYDRNAAATKKEGQDQWNNAYLKLLDERSRWTEKVNKQISDGLKQWETASIALSTNQQKAMAELQKYTEISNDQWKSHINGLEQVMTGSADAITTILENKRWYADAIKRSNQQGSLVTPTMRGIYETELAKWSALETSFRQIILQSQNSIHDNDLRSASGLLTPGSNMQVYTVEEWDLKVAQRNLAVLKSQKDKAQAVYDYATNANRQTATALEASLTTAKTNYENQEKVYLDLLATLNKGGGLNTGSAGLTPESGNTANTPTAPAGPTAQDTLQQAKDAYAEKKKALDLAKSNLDNAVTSYNQAMELQILYANGKDLLGQISVTDPDNKDNPDSGIKFDLINLSNEIATSQETLKTVEQVYYRNVYNSENATRSRDFFDDVYKRIKSFEASKGSLAAISGVLSNPNTTLINKLTTLSDVGNNILLGIYDTETAATIKEDILNLKNDLDPNKTDLPIGDAVTAFTNALSPLIDGTDALLGTYSQKDMDKFSDVSAKLADSESFFNSLKSAAGDDAVSYLGLSSYHESIVAYNTILSSMGAAKTDLTDAKGVFQTAVNDFKTFADANPNDKASLQFQKKILALSDAAEKFRSKASDFIVKGRDLQRNALYLEAKSLDLFSKAGAIADTSIYGDARTNIKASLTTSRANLENIFHAKDKPTPAANAPELTADTSLDLTDVFTRESSKEKSLGDLFTTYDKSLNDWSTKIGEKSAKFQKASMYLSGLQDSLKQSEKAQKSELTFLLDTDASIDKLYTESDTLSLEVKIRGAKLNEAAAKLLRDTLTGLAESQRNPDTILLNLGSVIDEKLKDFNTTDEFQDELRTYQIVSAYISQNYGSIKASLKVVKNEDGTLNNTEYTKFTDALAKSYTESKDITNFYADDDGKLSATDRENYRFGTDTQKRILAEYFQTGSSQSFGAYASQFLQGDLKRLQGFSSFVEAVKAKVILNPMTDDYYKGQENKVTGILSQITTNVSGLSDLQNYVKDANGNPKKLSDIFYGDVLQSSTAVPVRDETRIGLQQTALSNFLSPFSSESDKVNALLNSDNSNLLITIFGFDAANSLKRDLLDVKDRIDSNDSTLAQFANVIFGNLQSIQNAITPTLDANGYPIQFNDTNKALYTSFASVFQNASALKAMDNLASPNYKLVNDTNGNPPGFAGNPPAIPAYINTYIDGNGKKSYESGYDASSQVVDSYNKTLANWDLTSVDANTAALNTLLADWNTKKNDIKAKSDDYKAKLADLQTFIQNNPNYAYSSDFQSKVTAITTSLNALITSINGAQDYQKSLEDKFKVLKASEEDALKQAKILYGGLNIGTVQDPWYQNLIMENVAIPPSGNAQDYLAEEIKSDFASYPGDYKVVKTTDETILKTLMNLELSMKMKGEDYTSIKASLDQNYTILDVVRTGARSQSSIQNASDEGLGILSQFSAVKGQLTLGISDRTTVLSNLNDRVVHFKTDGTATSNVGLDSLYGYVNDLREYFLKKNIKGEAVNNAVISLLEEAGSFTDEIENIKYYLAGTKDKTVSDTNLQNAQGTTKALTDASGFLSDFSGLINSIQASGQSFLQNSDAVNTILTKYEQVKTAMGDKFVLNPQLQTMIDEMKSDAWEVYKKGIANVFISGQTTFESLNDFISGLRAGTYGVVSPSGTYYNVKSDFLGKTLTDAQITEIQSYLTIYDKERKITEKDVLTDLDAYLQNEDPDVKAALKEFALNQFFFKVKDARDSKGYEDERNVPTELKNYAIVSNFQTYLENALNADGTKRFDLTNANSRLDALNSYILALGPEFTNVVTTDANGTQVTNRVLDTSRRDTINTVLTEFLTNYATRNASYYLSDKLKEKEVAIHFFSESYTKNLSYDDMTSLTNWIMEEKYDPSLVSDAKAAARIDYILKNYYGEDEKNLSGTNLANPQVSSYYGQNGAGYFDILDKKLESLGESKLTAAEKQEFVRIRAGIQDPIGAYMTNPSSIINLDIFNTNYTFTENFSGISGILDGEIERLALDTLHASQKERKEKYANDVLHGLMKIQSYESYLPIKDGKDPVLNANGTAIDEATQISNRLSELSKMAKMKLGAYFKTLESQESFVYSNDTETAKINPSLRTLSGQITGSGLFQTAAYTISDTEYAKDGNGQYTFETDLGSIKGILDVFVNENTAGSVDFDKVGNQVSSNYGSMESGKKELITLGNSYIVVKSKAGADASQELQNASNTMSAANSEFQTAKSEFELAQTNLNNAQSGYLNTQTQVSVAYNAMLGLQDTFQNQASIYDMATLLDYNQGQSDAKATERKNAIIADALKNKDDANKAYNDKLTEVAKLQKKVDDQVKVAEVEAAVQPEREQVQSWAEKAAKLDLAEKNIQARIDSLKQDIRTTRQRLLSNADWFLHLDNSNKGQFAQYLEDSYDVNEGAYTSKERAEKARMNLIDGIRMGKIDAMDFVTSFRGGYAQGENANSDPNLRYYNPQNFYNQYGYSANMQASRDAFNMVSGAAIVGNIYQIRAGSNGSGAYYNGVVGMVNESLAITAASFQLFLAFPLTAGYGAALLSQYQSRISTWQATFNSVQTAVTNVKGDANTLFNLNGELQKLTDIQNMSQLRNALRDTGGLTDAEIDSYLNSSDGSLKNIKWTGKNTGDIGFSALVSSDGKRLAHNEAVKDRFGFYLRAGETDYIGTNIDMSGATQEATGTRMMTMLVGADQVADTLSTLAKSEYELARDKYFTKADTQTFVRDSGNIKADRVTILNERENFYYSLINIAVLKNNPDIAIYKEVLQDYYGDEALGKQGIVRELFTTQLQQTQAKQIQEWQIKADEFQKEKNEWVKNVVKLKEIGLARWDEMTTSFGNQRKAWEDDFTNRDNENKQKYFNKIKETLLAKKAWTEEFVEKSKNVSDQDSIAALYNQISGLVEGMREAMPDSIPLGVNVNDILSTVLASKPSETFSSLLMNRGSLVDVNFFLNEVKKYNFNDASILNKFNELLAQKDNLAKNLVIYQALDGLINLPNTYQETIKKANESLDAQMDGIMVQGKFIRYDGEYVRKFSHPMLNTEIIQRLPTYQDFFYAIPGLPTIKSANGTTWDLRNVGLLTASIQNNTIGAAEFGAMVSLARKKMDSDFSKVYDPRKEALTYKWEQEAMAGDSSGASARNYASRQASMLRSMNAANCSQSACPNLTTLEGQDAVKDSGYLVGKVEGGTFGKHHFDQFWKILSMKEDADVLWNAKQEEIQNPTRRMYNDLVGIPGRTLNRIQTLLTNPGGMLTPHGLNNSAQNSINSYAGDHGTISTNRIDKSISKAAGWLDSGYKMLGFGNSITNFQEQWDNSDGRDELLDHGRYVTLGDMSNALGHMFTSAPKKFRYDDQAMVRDSSYLTETDQFVDNAIRTGLTAVQIVGSVLAVAGAVFSWTGVGAAIAVGGASAAMSASVALTAYKAARANYTGGAQGVLAEVAAGVANYFLAETGLRVPGTSVGISAGIGLSYDYQNGWGGSVSANFGGREGGLGLSSGMSYNAQEGWGGRLGVSLNTGQEGDMNRFTGVLGISRSEYGGNGAYGDAGYMYKGSNISGSMGTGFNYNQMNGFSASINAGLGNQPGFVRGHNGTLTYNQNQNALSGDITMDYNMAKMMDAMGQTARGIWTGLGYVFGGRREDEHLGGSGLDSLFGFDKENDPKGKVIDPLEYLDYLKTLGTKGTKNFKEVLALESGKNLVLAGEDGNKYVVSKSKDGKTMQVIIYNSDGKAIGGYQAWNRDNGGDLKKFELLQAPENSARPTIKTLADGTVVSTPMSGAIVENDGVHGPRGSADYPVSKFHDDPNSPHGVPGHGGTDMQSATKELFAVEGGKILSIDPYNNTIKVRTNSGYIVNYLHTSGIATGIFPGAEVSAGQFLGRMGGASNSQANGFAPHLHLEVYDSTGRRLTTAQARNRYWSN